MYRYWVSIWLFVIGIGCLLLSNRSAIAASYGPVWHSPEYFNAKAKDFTLLKKGNLWYIIAINDPDDPPPPDQPESPGLPVSTSYDLSHWTYQGVAIPVGATGSWDDRAAWAPTIVQSGDTYYLYYAGVHIQNGVFVQKIGLATSTDLINWTKSDSNPVYDCSHVPWAYWNLNDTAIGGSCRDPYVIRDEPNNRWVMFFSANLAGAPDAPYKGITNPSVVGMATSTDLVHWTDAGYIPATRGYTAESPHVIEHDGTWYLISTSNCHFQGTIKCLVYSTAPSLTGPYTGYTDLPAIDDAGFASEYYRDADGTEYFGAVITGTVFFYNLDWSSGGFGLNPIPQATIKGIVWNDLNRNGIQDPGEPGINQVNISTYRDNGDGVFDATKDYPMATSATRNLGFNGTRQDGVYSFTSVQPGTNWFVVRPDNFTTGGALAGLTSTTSSGTTGVYNVTTTETVSTMSFGYALPDTTPPAAVNDLAAQ